MVEPGFLGGRTRTELMRQFVAAHQNATNKAFHLVGIPTVVLAGLSWSLVPFVPAFWIWPTVFMPLGFACQFVGHHIEGNRPEVFTDWRFVFVGLEWWWQLVRGRA